MNERVGWIFFGKTNVKLLPVVGAAVDGGPENEWKWNTVNKNVLSNTFLFGVCDQYHTTKPFFPLVFHSFSLFFTASTTYKLKKRNTKQSGKPYTRFQSQGHVRKNPAVAASVMLITCLVVEVIYVNAILMPLSAHCDLP